RLIHSTSPPFRAKRPSKNNRIKQYRKRPSNMAADEREIFPLSEFTDFTDRPSVNQNHRKPTWKSLCNVPPNELAVL
ncbi:MAG: hypothetical protein IJ074_07955, partial [Clostridia bacterium]|nr:hypothetical protein [Clostridia bacterium]